MAKPIIFTAGIPGTGKSSYGRWLAKAKGFTYIDMEHDDLDVQGFRPSWDEFTGASGSDRFITELLSHPSPVCLDWGFPPQCVPIVRRLAQGGIDLWWFDADEAIAKKYFLRRATVSEAAFDTQMARIESARDQIMPLFRDHVITVITSDGVHLQNEDIYARMFEK
jgi:hypothetical protein